MFMMDNHSMNSTDTLYDEDGCFYTHQLRDTREYQTYLKVNGSNIFTLEGKILKEHFEKQNVWQFKLMFKCHPHPFKSWKKIGAKCV